MIGLLGSIGWGLLACGAITHVWHHGQLQRLLALHLDHERVPAILLTAIEVALVVGLAIAWLTDAPVLTWFAVAAFTLALGFLAWIARLLLTGSALPCACSFSEAPTSWWSFARAACVAMVGLLAFAPDTASQGSAETVATLGVGWALAAGVFVLPEALAWPAASRALLQRVDAHSEPAT